MTSRENGGCGGLTTTAARLHRYETQNVAFTMNLPCFVVGGKTEEEERQMRGAEQMVPETADWNMFLQHVFDVLSRRTESRS